MTSAAANLGTMAVRDGFAFALDPLARWMDQHVDGYVGPLTVEQFRGGQSNPTYKLITPNRSYVMRRKPPGQLVQGAHAVEREAKVLSGLHPTGFPVPKVYALCTEPAVIGTWFYVMELVEGRIFWDATFPGLGIEERARCFDSMNATIARLHQVNYEAAGLADFGRATSYLERQIARWSRQYQEDTEAGADSTMDRLVQWLPRNIPAGDETTVVHGDFRCDNMIFAHDAPRVAAVLDWELSTLGHPGVDFANHAMMYRMPPQIVAGLLGADLDALGIPSEQDYLSAYCERTGRAEMPGYDFYVAFNFFRLAAIFHGIKGRVIRGTATSTQASDRVEVLPQLISLAWEQAQRAGA